MRKRLFLTIALAASVSLQAATISLAPGTQSLIVGSTGTVDVQVGGLTAGQTIGSFDLSVLSNPLIITATNVAFLGALGDPSLEITDSSLTTGSTEGTEVSLEETSTLSSLQSTTPFSLFRITYQGVGAGTSQLSFAVNPAILSDGAGAIVPITSFGTASISVAGSGTPQAPEPASWMLLCGGTAVLVLLSRLRIAKTHS